MNSIVIYHNPRCSKSRQTLELLEKLGIKPEIIHYLENPPDQKMLKKILAMLDMRARNLLRESEEEYITLGLSNPDLDEDDLINAMFSHPRLIQRPIVVNGNKAAIGRPPEQVKDIL